MEFYPYVEIALRQARQRTARRSPEGQSASGKWRGKHFIERINVVNELKRDQ